MTDGYSVDSHFDRSSPVVRETYQRVLDIARDFGPFTEVPKKTSIHLDRKSAFAGIQTRKEFLILTVKSPVELSDPRIRKREHISANRWYFEIKLRTPNDIDRQVVDWLRNGYEISG
jgi:hypothetical protein